MVQLTSNFKGHKLQAAGAGGGLPKKMHRKCGEKKHTFLKNVPGCAKSVGGKAQKSLLPKISPNLQQLDGMTWKINFKESKKLGGQKK